MPFDLMIFLAMLLYKSAVFYDVSILSQMTPKMKVILFIFDYDLDYLAGCYSKVLPCSMMWVTMQNKKLLSYSFLLVSLRGYWSLNTYQQYLVIIVCCNIVTKDYSYIFQMRILIHDNNFMMVQIWMQTSVTLHTIAFIWSVDCNVLFI